MIISPIPTYTLKNNKLSDGTLFKAPVVCKKTNNEKCIKHYRNIKEKKGFHICHAGLTSYSTGVEKEPVYTAFRGEGYYDNKKIKQYKSDYLPTIPQKIILTSIYKVSSSLTNDVKIEEDKELINSILHEVRTLNSQIKRFSESIIKNNTNTQKNAQSIFASSTLISARLSAYDIENNPHLLSSSGMLNTGFFEKFQKASHCLESLARDNHVQISGFIGHSYGRKDLYPIFDFLPYVISENAIKYSPKDQDITVTFTETRNETLVTVSSIGPTIDADQINDIFNKGFRGDNAIKMDAAGGGYGLYFAKLICDLNDIEIQAFSNPAKINLNTIDFSEFEISLKMAF